MALRVDDVDIARDRALVRRFQAGDDEAFDELYRRYHDRLERFCLRRTGDPFAAEEMAQEAFTRALTALPDLGGDLHFYPWVSVIAARLCIDYFRRQTRPEPFPDPSPSPDSRGPEEGLVDAVDASLAAAALARLAPRHQDVLHLREVEGWSYHRIADHYGVPVGTVETLLFRARRALRREFRLVDGAALAAIPLLRRVVALAHRARSRLPSLPPAPSLSAVAAAATATVAVVAVSVAPRTSPVTPTRPAAQQPPVAHRAAPGGGSASTFVSVGAPSPPSSRSSPIAGPLVAPAASAAGAASAIGPGDTTTTTGPAATTTTTLVTAAGVTPTTSISAPAAPPTTTPTAPGGGLPIVGPLLDSTSPPLPITGPPAVATIAGALPPVPLPGIDLAGTVAQTGLGPLLPPVGGLLPGG